MGFVAPSQLMMVFSILFSKILLFILSKHLLKLLVKGNFHYFFNFLKISSLETLTPVFSVFIISPNKKSSFSSVSKIFPLSPNFFTNSRINSALSALFVFITNVCIFCRFIR